MHLHNFFEMSRDTVLITGGSGYIGHYICDELVSLGSNVILYDRHSPEFHFNSENVTFVRGDICDLEAMTSALTNFKVESVIHCAGFGLSGTSNLPAFDKITQKVNVFGTKVVIEACLKSRVRHLVFTSTVNVAFSGKEIINGDEESHKWLETSHCDVYSRSKQKGEQIVIESNGKLNGSGKQLKTCTLRLAGVYGPKEEIILGRSVRLISCGIARDTFSQKEGLRIDFVHIRNVVQAHVKALQTLQNSDAASGQIFNITDDNPTDLRYFLNPLYSMITNGKEKTLPRPKILIPMWVPLIISRLFALMSIIFGKRFKLPFWGFTVMESYKISTDHFFSISKARNVLGYHPQPCTKKDWLEINQSLKHLLLKDQTTFGEMILNFCSKIFVFLRLIGSYTVFLLCSIYVYIILYGTLLGIGV